jgi:broad specificity phosphatase PhoE
MVAAGVFGGAGRGQGRKAKNRTAGAEVADLAAREASTIKKVYSAGLRSQNERTRLMAAKDLLAEERRELDRRDYYESELRGMTHAELERMFIETLVAALDENGKLPLEWRMLLAGEPFHWTVNQIDVFEIMLPDWFDTDLEEDGEPAEDVVDAEVVVDDPANDIDVESALAELGAPIEKTENVSAPPPPRQFGLRAWPRAPAGDS